MRQLGSGHVTEQPQDTARLSPEYAPFCVHAFLGSAASNRGVYDFASGAAVSFVQSPGGAVELADVGVGRLGRWFRTDRGSTVPTGGNVPLASAFRSRNVTGEFTVIAAINRVPSRVSGIIGKSFGSALATSGMAQIQWWSDNRFYFDISNETQRVANLNTTSGDCVVVLSWDNQSKVKRCWLNGALLFSDAADSDSISDGSDPYIALGNGIECYGFALFDRRFQNEMELSINPWQIYEPQRMYTPNVNVATFRPHYYRKSSAMLGSGVI